ncbi:ABC-F family ATP-binding cassette domain-containing protein [Candidatus Woesebacteria bacterium]|nr:ABC-F family ATP-binding cassette domain-containing protein [Candidatus Woesebacteria bacterium]
MLNIKNITKSITSKTLFENVTFKLSENQKVGFVGPNGAGKTTLLKIIAGLTEPDAGVVQKTGEVIGYLPQKIDADESMMIYQYLYEFLRTDWEEYKIKTSLAIVGLGKVDQSMPISSLSGGQKMKLGLARLLLCEPTILLLDEPTNNLDMQSLTWLEKFIKNFDGKILLVSHDRTFLDNCVNKIIELDPFNKTIHEYGGNYSKFVIEKKQRQENILADYNVQQKKEQRMIDWIKEKQEQLKYHPSNKVAAQLQAMKTRMNREIEEDRIIKPQNYKSFSIDQMGSELHKKKSILVIKDFSISGLVSCEELYVFAKERIHFSGKNGSGKTTFIKSIVGLNSNYTGEIEFGPNVKIGYFSQEHEILDLKKSVIDNFVDLSPLKSEAKARSVLGSYLFSDDKVFSRVEFLSEGEKARLIFAILISQNNDFLLLDEPTNHLDIESREVLEEALTNYEGGFIVISHDRYFLKQIGINREISIRDGQIV